MTETLLSWGVRPAAVTRFCPAPGIPTVGGTKNPDLAAITALHPDVVLMDEEENRREDAAALEAAGTPVHATAIRRFEDVAPALAAVAAALGLAETPGPGDHDPPGPPGTTVPVYVPIWRRPWMTVGGPTYASSLLACAGFDNVFAPDPEPYPRAGPEDAAGLGPRFVLAPSEPYHFTERHRAELETAAPVLFVDGQDLFWWGSRTTAALERLRRLAAALQQK
jgi:hypothetical protein